MNNNLFNTILENNRTYIEKIINTLKDYDSFKRDIKSLKKHIDNNNIKYESIFIKIFPSEINVTVNNIIDGNKISLIFMSRSALKTSLHNIYISKINSNKEFFLEASRAGTFLNIHLYDNKEKDMKNYISFSTDNEIKIAISFNSSKYNKTEAEARDSLNVLKNNINAKQYHSEIIKDNFTKRINFAINFMDYIKNYTSAFETNPMNKTIFSNEKITTEELDILNIKCDYSNYHKKFESFKLIDIDKVILDNSVVLKQKIKNTI